MTTTRLCDSCATFVLVLLMTASLVTSASTAAAAAADDDDDDDEADAGCLIHQDQRDFIEWNSAAYRQHGCVVINWKLPPPQTVSVSTTIIS